MCLCLCLCLCLSVSVSVCAYVDTMATETSLGRYVEDTRNLLATRLRDSVLKSCKLMW